MIYFNTEVPLRYTLDGSEPSTTHGILFEALYVNMVLPGSSSSGNFKYYALRPAEETRIISNDGDDVAIIIKRKNEGEG